MRVLTECGLFLFPVRFVLLLFQLQKRSKEVFGAVAFRPFVRDRILTAVRELDLYSALLPPSFAKRGKGGGFVLVPFRSFSVRDPLFKPDLPGGLLVHVPQRRQDGARVDRGRQVFV